MLRDVSAVEVPTEERGVTGTHLAPQPKVPGLGRGVPTASGCANQQGPRTRKAEGSWRPTRRPDTVHGAPSLRNSGLRHRRQLDERQGRTGRNGTDWPRGGGRGHGRGVALRRNKRAGRRHCSVLSPPHAQLAEAGGRRMRALHSPGASKAPLRPTHTLSPSTSRGFSTRVERRGSLCKL